MDKNLGRVFRVESRVDYILLVQFPQDLVSLLQVRVTPVIVVVIVTIIIKFDQLEKNSNELIRPSLVEEVYADVFPVIFIGTAGAVS